MLIEDISVLAYPRSMSASYHSTIASSTKANGLTDLQSLRLNTTSNVNNDMISHDVAASDILLLKSDVERSIIHSEKNEVRNKRYETRHARFELVKVALLMYKNLNGNIRVPQGFVVPKDNDFWPEGTQGMNLGSIVQNVRGGKRYVERRNELENIGFEFGPQKAKYGYTLTKAALILYKKTSERNDMQVPYNYIVEENIIWPKAMWGMKLGQIFNNIKKKGGNYADRRVDLQNIGFSFDVYNSKYHVVKLSLLKYRELNGNMLVPRRFIVPQTQEWPKATWGLKLGGAVYNIRGGSSYADCREDLISIGFRFDALQAKYDIFRVSLLKYKELYGDMLVPKGFKVPANSIDWPVESWGMKLGSMVKNIRGSKGCFSDKKHDLLSIGFIYVVRKKFDYECVKIAFFKYRELHHGCIKIPAVYNIPEHHSWYPEETWGMCLGSIIDRIRKGEKWPEHRAELLGLYEYGN
jgi:hypothetical protein